MSGRALLLAFAFAAALAALPAAPARAANWLEMNFYLSGPEYEGKLPPCDYRDALLKIASRFNEKENMYWTTDLRIVEISDGRRHVIHYSIAEDSGMIGASWGIEWCIVGLDRNWAYNPACKMARP